MSPAPTSSDTSSYICIHIHARTDINIPIIAVALGFICVNVCVCVLLCVTFASKALISLCKIMCLFYNSARPAHPGFIFFSCRHKHCHALKQRPLFTSSLILHVSGICIHIPVSVQNRERVNSYEYSVDFWNIF